IVFVPPGGIVVEVASIWQMGAGVTGGPPPSIDVGQELGPGDVGFGLGQTPATGPYSTFGLGQTPATGPGDGGGVGQTPPTGSVGCGFGQTSSVGDVCRVGQ